MLTPSALTRLLREHNLRLTKRLGQHHLIDRGIIDRIVDACGISSQDRVVEIGAGLGALTEPLASRAGSVLAIEVDRRICGLLRERAQHWPGVEVVCADILDLDWEEARNSVVVGAIPYQITAPILLALCEARRHIRKAVLIVQEEVADRLMAEPGSKPYGRLSVLGQYCWELSGLLTVPRSAFYPIPTVDSRCVQLRARTRPAAAVTDEALFFQIVKLAFAQRRKTLVNCLTTPTAHATVRMARGAMEATLNRLGLPPTVRGEALSIAQFARLTAAVERVRAVR